ncbi:hypothetical protein D9756_000299 [Leucocoprinus leucothites]|uniref:Uncharacterized protein n=1 Tax=Leucocoprinus leucothites TaxID=201217 RepID=A0A8H5GEY9_9AGAR|nr:hypothetical protein D9756_000299 [Leucoagaricus leucothites]
MGMALANPTTNHLHLSDIWISAYLTRMITSLA